MKLFLKCLVVLLVWLTNHPIFAQIISSGHTESVSTSYPVHANNDLIYLYSDVSLGTLTAMPVVGSNINYTWYKFEKNNWIELTSGNSPELTTPLEETAYQVRITDNGNPVGQYQCWILKPEILSAEIDTILNTCTSLQQAVKTTTKPLYYYDLTSFEQTPLDYSFSYLWSSSPDGGINGNTLAEPTIDAPLDSTTFMVTVSAFNGAHQIKDENKFYPIAVKADFTFNATDRDHENEYPKPPEFVDITSFEGSSPISLSINNKSKGAINRYTWEVYDNEDNLFTDDIGTNPSIFEFTELNQTYNISLQVKNTIRGCVDKQQQGPITTTKEMIVEAPNVFTPDGDGINDKFMVAYQSVKGFKMVIVNRWGRKVFQTTNPADYWDGKIGGRKAAAGVYFYYIDAEGFNGKHEKYNAPIHLFRGN